MRLRLAPPKPERMRNRALFCLLPFTAAGCAEGRDGFPSLAPRAIEQKGFEEPEVAAPAPIAADPALDKDIADAGVTLAEIARRFDAAVRTAGSRAAAARGSGAGSDAWLDAQTALAELDSIQAGATDLLSSLEDRAMARAAELASPYPALDAAVARARATVEAQRVKIRTIAAGLATT